MSEQTRQRGGAVTGPQRGNVLFIDDEPLVLHAYTRALQRSGIGVDPVSDSKGVPELLERGGYDAVFCDISMPGLDGLEILDMVKGRDPDLPVVLVTGGSLVASAVRAVELGALRYLMKPIDLDVLRRSANEAIGLRKLALLKRQAYGLAGEDAARPGPIFSCARGGVVAHVMGARDPAPDDGELLVVVMRADELLEVSALPPPERAVYLTVDEREAAARPGRLRDRVEELLALGYRTGLDGLGTSPVGLAVLAEVAPGLVRLPPGLIRDIDGDGTRRTLVTDLVSACVGLGIVLVAPGVRSRGERDALMAAGCDLMQPEGDYRLD